MYIHTYIHNVIRVVYNLIIGVVQSSVIVRVSVTLGCAAIVIIVIVLSSAIYWKVKHTCKNYQEY